MMNDKVKVGEDREMVFDRSIQSEDFTTLVGQLSEIQAYITEDQDAHGWSMQWRPENYIFFYYRMQKFAMKIYKRPAGKFRVEADERYKKLATGVDFKNKIDISLMAALMKDWLKEMKRVIGDDGDQERVTEQRIATKLEHNNDFFILDVEVVVGQGKKDSKKNNIEKQRGRSGNTEADLLALIRNSDGRYRFVPIELKLAKSETLQINKCGGLTAVGQACEFCSIINSNIADFKKTYEEVYYQKRQAGIFNGGKEIDITKEVHSPMVVVIKKDHQQWPSLNNQKLLAKLKECATDKLWDYEGKKSCGREFECCSLCEVTVIVCTEDELIEWAKSKGNV